jgi:hypothetical protein
MSQLGERFARWPGLENAAEQSTAKGTGGHASPVMMTCRMGNSLGSTPLSIAASVCMCTHGQQGLEGQPRDTPGGCLGEDMIENEQHQGLMILLTIMSER